MRRCASTRSGRVVMKALAEVAMIAQSSSVPSVMARNCARGALASWLMVRAPLIPIAGIDAVELAQQGRPGQRAAHAAGGLFRLRQDAVDERLRQIGRAHV